MFLSTTMASADLIQWALQEQRHRTLTSTYLKPEWNRKVQVYSCFDFFTTERVRTVLSNFDLDGISQPTLDFAIKNLSGRPGLVTKFMEYLVNSERRILSKLRKKEVTKEEYFHAAFQR